MCEEDKIAEPSKDIATDLMSAVTYAYLNPTKDTADEDGHSQLKLLAEDFGMTPIKVRKMLITSGAYGTTSNRVSVQQVKRGGKIRYALSRIWLPYDSLKFHYPSLEGKRFLLPFYEIRRWCKLIFRGGARRGINEMHLNATATKEAQSRTAQMLSELGLNR